MKLILVIVGIVMLLFVVAVPEFLATPLVSDPQVEPIVKRTASTETTCKNGKCNLILYSGVRFAQNKSGEWVNPSEILKITKNSDDLTFTYNGIKGDYSITFETGLIYNNNYYSMYDVKQLKPQIQFNFPTKKLPATRKYAVNITNIPIDMQPNIQNITLTYKSHSGFTLSQLKSEKGKFLIKDIFELTFDDLKEAGFIVKINKAEKRIYIGNLSDKFVGDSLYLDPTIKLQEANSENLDDKWVAAGTSVGGDRIELTVRAPTIRRTYIKFNISSIDGTMIIEDSELCLTHYSGATYAQKVEFHHVYNVTWTEEAMEGDDQPCGVDFNNSSNCNLTATDSLTWGAETSGLRCWNVTAPISIDKANLSVSFALKVGNEDNSIVPLFRSKEYTTVTLRPYLNITYSEAADTCSCPTSENWNVDCIDNCSITEECDITGYNLTINGAVGSFDILADIKTKQFAHQKGCKVNNVPNDGNELIVG